MLYRSYNELKNKTLKFRDEVYFTINNKTYKYVVSNCFLNNYSDSNWIIFNKLKLNETKFCSEAYGYEAEYGAFPESHLNDYEALTRVTLALLKLCDNYFELNIWE